MPLAAPTCPGCPRSNGADGTYALNSTFANEFFFQCDGAEMPWEAALDAHGQGLYRGLHPRLKYRKLFCWGSHAGGRHWQEFLSAAGRGLPGDPGRAGAHPGARPAHAGAARLGLDPGLWLRRGRPGQRPQPGLGRGLGRGRRGPEGQTLARRSCPQLEEACRARADQPGGELLPTRLGLGRAGTAPAAAGAARLHGARPAGAFVFPDETLARNRSKWLALLEQGALPEQDPAQPARRVDGPAGMAGAAGREPRRTQDAPHLVCPAAPGRDAPGSLR